MKNEEILRFYLGSEWKAVRDEVLRLDHNECQMCKAQGKYTKAQVVHHVQHLKDRPDLALSIWHRGQRQLVSLCNECHNKVHPEKGIRGKAKAVLTNEWW